MPHLADMQHDEFSLLSSWFSRQEVFGSLEGSRSIQEHLSQMGQVRCGTQCVERCSHKKVGTPAIRQTLVDNKPSCDLPDDLFAEGEVKPMRQTKKKKRAADVCTATDQGSFTDSEKLFPCPRQN